MTGHDVLLHTRAINKVSMENISSCSYISVAERFIQEK